MSGADPACAFCKYNKVQYNTNRQKTAEQHPWFFLFRMDADRLSRS